MAWHSFFSRYTPLAAYRFGRLGSLKSRSGIGLLLAAMSLLLSACGTPQHTLTKNQAQVDYDLLFALPERELSFVQQVQPILERRCVVCHGCYDAPCQLKLSSIEGIQRGASKERVYDGARIKPADPTRLFIDATTTDEWRQKGFHSVLNESKNNRPQENLESSLFYRMLRLKQLHPQPQTGMVSADFDLQLDRKQTCPTADEFDTYAKQHPLQGMPFAMPNLRPEEYRTLVHWLAQGSPQDAAPVISPVVKRQIESWELFFNGRSKKQRLVSRYLYEHLFHAHIHFQGSGEREFYRLVRSSTPPGTAAQEIAAIRPYGDPGLAPYYRILPLRESIVAKTHLVYELSDRRMQRFQELFLDPDYNVASLPNYAAELASNPIKAFESLPVKSRYRFLLDDARFFIEGFVKGPVCRGQIALNVIEDQFWVFFFDPEAPLMSTNPEYLHAMADYLALPAELESTMRLLAVESHYERLLQKYRQARRKFAESFQPVDLDQAMDFIWDGAGTNPNAALTVFRHLDSASVSKGLIGDYPETAWVLDYPTLERIHYLLVAGFNVYGNLGHQLNTRLYMDFLRMEGEDYFLTLLPAFARKGIRDGWYAGIRSDLKHADEVAWWIDREIVTGYQSDDPQRELYRRLEQRLGPLAGNDRINRFSAGSSTPSGTSAKARADKVLRGATNMRGEIIGFLPDLSFLRVKLGGQPESDLAYTLISNKAYKHVRSMFANEQLGDRRDYAQDTQTVVDWLEGAYPNFFYQVDIDAIEDFVNHYSAITNRDDYERFIARYGVRRTNPDFWALADWFHATSAREQPLESGLFDLNRYQNR